MSEVPLPDAAYTRLLTLRTGLRHFERWSAEQARAAGLTPAQHQLMLAIRGHAGAAGPTIGDVADYLLLRHHSAVGLVDRAEGAGLVYRVRDDEDHRVVRLRLTAEGAKRLEGLSALHLEELDRLALDLPAAWAGLPPVDAPPVEVPSGTRGSTGSADAPGRHLATGIARVYDHPDASLGRRILVDRLWPRGLAKTDAPIDEWVKDVAPSTELRRWYGHVPERFEAFSARYRGELTRSPAREALAKLRSAAGATPLVLVTATKDLDRSGAAVVRDVLTER